VTVNFIDGVLDEESTTPGFALEGITLGHRAGAQKLGASLYELPPGQAICPYHWHAANEELLVVLEGPVELRDREGWRTVPTGEVVAFPRGEAGAHQVRNAPDATKPVRVIVFSEKRYPEIPVYPDSEKLGVREAPPGSPGIRLNFRTADAVDYWDGERPPEGA
jgi:uncharacterized cupin superfamily protein